MTISANGFHDDLNIYQLSWKPKAAKSIFALHVEELKLLGDA
jgi:hypothetical protein